MGFDPRRWRPSSGSRPLTTNVEALLAENEALRREVRSLRLQLEAFLQGESGSRCWDPPQDVPATGAAAESRPPWTTAGDAAQAAAARQPGGAWSAAARSRASRSCWSSGEPARQRVTVGSSHGISADLVDRWGRALARHPRWQELRLGPPGGLRGLELELRRHWWNPGLSLEQELDRLCPGLGGELAEALRGPHSRGRWAVRAAFALYGPRAPEWLSEEPLRVAEQLLLRVQQLQQQTAAGSRRTGTRTANHSEAAADRGARTDRPPGPGTAGASGGGGPQADTSPGQGRHRQGRGAGPRAGEQASGRSDRAAPRQARTPDPRTQALALLGLDPCASATAIKRAYRRLAKAHHPDLGGDAEAFRRLDAAYRSLL